jgi:glycosyltransferase involved in cell wall biosynthesis
LKILYITNINIKKNNTAGVVRKILGQVNGFIKLGHDIDLSLRYGKISILIDTIEKKHYLLNQIDKILCARKKKTLYYLKRQISRVGYDVIYIRFSKLNLGTLAFLSRIKPHTKLIVLEIPTYPYMREKLAKIPKSDYWSHIGFYKQLLIDFVIKSVIRKYIGLIVLTIPKKRLWGIPVVFTENGIDLNKMSLKKKKTDSASITICTATNIDIWQGLDRLILGLQRFYRDRSNDLDIKIKIAGEGSQKEFLERLTRKLDLETQVSFHGQLTGKDLDGFYNEADIAVGSLGRHRQMTNFVSTLKIKEYCAKGIPFIYSNDEPSLTGKEDFALKLPANDNCVNIYDVINFYEQVKVDPQTIDRMRKFARNYDWVTQIKRVDHQLTRIIKENWRKSTNTLLS